MRQAAQERKSACLVAAHHLVPPRAPAGHGRACLVPPRHREHVVVVLTWCTHAAETVAEPASEASSPRPARDRRSRRDGSSHRPAIPRGPPDPRRVWETERAGPEQLSERPTARRCGAVMWRLNRTSSGRRTHEAEQRCYPPSLGVGKTTHGRLCSALSLPTLLGKDHDRGPAFHRVPRSLFGGLAFDNVFAKVGFGVEARVRERRA